MDYVPLGRSGLVTSVVGLGGGSSSRFGLVKGGTRSDALALIRAAFDQGITFFDGAGICGDVEN
jgi:aryl-alcohol dehydrogenase-like predicted oxidoreductase